MVFAGVQFITDATKPSSANSGATADALADMPKQWTLALELGRHNVRVNCVTPSLVVDTKAHDRVMASEFSSRIFEKASRRARLGVPNPADVAMTAVFLASPLSSRTTGQAVSVNGGISAA